MAFATLNDNLGRVTYAIASLGGRLIYFFDLHFRPPLGVDRPDLPYPTPHLSALSGVSASCVWRIRRLCHSRDPPRLNNGSLTPLWNRSSRLSFAEEACRAPCKGGPQCRSTPVRCLCFGGSSPNICRHSLGPHRDSSRGLHRFPVEREATS